MLDRSKEDILLSNIRFPVIDLIKQDVLYQERQLIKLKNMITEFADHEQEENDKLTKSVAKLNEKYDRLKKVVAGLVFISAMLVGAMSYFVLFMR